MKGVFTTRVVSTYDDLPEARYHFPRTYLSQVRATIGDQIIYYEPARSDNSGARNGRKAYYAVAEVKDVIPDINRGDCYYAIIDNYLEFDEPVPFRMEGQTLERKLQKDDGSINKGAFGRAVRNISDEEFQTVLALGFNNHSLDFVPDRSQAEGGLESGYEFHEEFAEFKRPIVELTQNRLFRDRAFARKVKQVYDRRCAFTGIRLVNGMGRPEVQAAHIKPVASHGPDSIRNGLALSSTFHWLFDRGLISLTDDFEFLIAKNKIPPEIKRLLNKDGRAHVPSRAADMPHKSFLRFHRENVFKG